MIQRHVMLKKLNNMLSPHRLEHSLNVEETAKRLAIIHGADVDVCSVAGLLHDCARDLTFRELIERANQNPEEVPNDCKDIPILLHSYIGAIVAREEFEVTDERILNAIRFHTLGDTNMSLEDKITCLADYIEPKRTFQGVDVVRDMAKKDVDTALLAAFDFTIKHLIKMSRRINNRLIDARNAILNGNKEYDKEEIFTNRA